MFSNPKSIQASVTLLEKLPVILDKSTEEDMRNLVLPLLFNSLESKMSQIQVCNVTCLTQFIWYHMQGYVYFRFALTVIHCFGRSLLLKLTSLWPPMLLYYLKFWQFFQAYILCANQAFLVAKQREKKISDSGSEG